MFVRDRMSAPVITVGANTTFPDALQLMQEHQFRRLPVVNQDGVLVGIVSERDLLHASPSPATSLSVWEMNYLLAKLKVSQLMTKEVTSVTPETPIEIAARMLVEHRIGGMPVVDAKRHVVGVITETDIFKAFVDMLGTGQPGLRLMLRVPNGKGVLARSGDRHRRVKRQYRECRYVWRNRWRRCVAADQGRRRQSGTIGRDTGGVGGSRTGCARGITPGAQTMKLRAGSAESSC